MDGGSEKKIRTLFFYLYKSCKKECRKQQLVCYIQGWKREHISFNDHLSSETNWIIGWVYYKFITTFYWIVVSIWRLSDFEFEFSMGKSFYTS